MIYTVSANPALDLTLTVPAIEFDTVLRAYEVRRECAGKAFNVSRFLHSLGVASLAMAVAAGHTGQFLEECLHKAGIATDFVYVAGETRTNVVIQEPEARRHVKVNQPGAAVTAGDAAAFLARAAGHVRSGDTWVLTGSLAPGMSPDFYAVLTTMLHEQGAQVVLDSSGPALRAGCAARPRLVKPNVVEAEEFTGRRIQSLEDAAAATQPFLAAGAEMVLLSMGKDGAVIAGEGVRYHVIPPAVQVKTAVGAGDALVSGAVWAMTQGLAAAEIGRWGVTVGTVTAQRDNLPEGAWDELREMAGQVQVVPLG